MRSSRPCSPATSSTSWVTASASRTSRPTADAREPRPAATCLAPSALTSASTTVSPRATRAVASAWPMPDAAPVTIPTRPMNMPLSVVGDVSSLQGSMLSEDGPALGTSALGRAPAKTPALSVGRGLSVFFPFDQFDVRGFGQLFLRQRTPGHVGAGQVRPVEPGAGQVRPPEPGAGQVHLAEPGAGQVRLAEPGAGQVRPGEPGTGEVRPGELGTGQVGPAELGVGQVGPAELGAGEARSDQVDGVLGGDSGTATQHGERGLHVGVRAEGRG